MLVKTMRVIALLCVVAGVLSLVPSRARAQEPGYCCTDSTDCTWKEMSICCNPEKVGAYPCAEQPRIGYCRKSCSGDPVPE